MNPSLFTLLNPKSTRLDGAGGGLPTLTANDINAACYQADKAGVEMLHRKYSDLPTYGTVAFSGLYYEVLAMAVRFNWKIRENAADKLARLLRLAIFETTKLVKCSTCKGTPERILPGKLRPTICPTCRGSGKYTIEKQDKAKAVGMKKQAWTPKWEDRYADIKIMAETKQHQANRKIGKNLT